MLYDLIRATVEASQKLWPVFRDLAIIYLLAEIANRL